MKINRLATAAGLVSAMMTGSAAAAEFYLEGFVGGPLPRNQRVIFEVTGLPPAAGTFKPGSGFGLGGAIGVYFTPSIRADIAVLHGWNNGGSFNPDGFPGLFAPVTGTVSATAIMANAYYEFLNESRFTPWIGAGLGATIYNYSNAGPVALPVRYNGTASAFTAAGHVGLDFALTDRIDVTGRYSLTYTTAHQINSTPPGLVQKPQGGFDNAFLIGLRVKFGG